MAGDKTRKRILDVAERHFAEQGFAATSLRRILADAKVNVAAIHYHFGNKEMLFSQVIERRMGLLNEERIEALDALEDNAPRGKVELEAIIEAFIRPLFKLAANSRYGPAWRKLICRYRLEPGSHWNCVEPLIAEMVERFIAAFRKVLPTLSEEDIAYRFHLLGGTAIDALADQRSLKWLKAGSAGTEDDQEELITRVVTFTAAGMRALLPPR
ncbi:MAG: TetR family transcriptional regulator [Planctomycetota bacterium]